MTRAITGAATTASQAEIVRPVMLVYLDFASGAVYVNSADRTIVFGGNSYLGVGNLGQISDMREGAELQADGVSLQLTGVPPDLIALALTDHYQGRAAKVWLAFLDASYALIADPVLAFSGRIDTIDAEIGDTGTLTLSAESRLIDWERPRLRYYTDVDQQTQYPGDLGLQFVSQVADETIPWGKST